jgi:hypothetical protein
MRAPVISVPLNKNPGRLVRRPILAAAAFQAALVNWLRSLPEGRLQPKLAALQDAISRRTNDFAATGATHFDHYDLFSL